MGESNNSQLSEFLVNEGIAFQKGVFIKIKFPKKNELLSELKNLYAIDVNKDQQGNGIGTKMMEYI